VDLIRACHDPAGRLGRTGRRLALAGIAFTAAGCAPTSVTEQDTAIHNDYNVFLYLAAVVFVVVSGLLVWSMIRYRRRNDELPKQIQGNTALELTWTLIPTAIVLVLFVVTIRAQNKATEPAAEPALTVDMTAFLWSRRFIYENTPAIPGVTNEFDLTFDTTGLFHGQCTQFCGLQHTDMVFRVRVVGQNEYQSWLASAARAGATGPPGR
jgi:cytochrome c oxidase subunit II